MVFRTNSPLTLLTCTLGVHHSLWDSLPVKVGHLVSEDHVLDQQRSSGSCSLQVQLVPHRVARPRGQRVGFLLGAHKLVRAAAGC